MDLSRVYHNIMQDVLTRSRTEFAAEHVSESTLSKLATLWETRLLDGINVEAVDKADEESCIKKYSIVTVKDEELHIHKRKKKEPDYPIHTTEKQIASQYIEDDKITTSKSVEDEIILSSDSDEELEGESS